ncbi:hypothetical protein DYD21_07380 [Rhodohalobacter sp. SW132]|nr:hypothetical protein DYD21_07380 [Rhodohalobacter sp. SW132]
MKFMQWLKQIVIDLFAIIVIALAVFYESNYLAYVVYTYTVLMVIARFLSLVSENFSAITKKKVSEAPRIVYHIIYCINVLILGIGGWYVTAGGWIFIWAAAAIVDKRSF